MAGAVTDLAGIGGGILWQIAGLVGFIAFCAGLSYATRWIMKGTKKAKAFNIKAIIVDLNGVIDFDSLAFTKSEESGLLEMIFKNRKTDSIPPIAKHLIKNGKVILLNYAPGHYCVIETSKTIGNFHNQIWKVIPFSLGMKNYIMAKQREIMNKAEEKKMKWEQRGPWITLVIAIVACVLLTAFLFITGAYFEGKNIAMRIAECGG